MFLFVNPILYVIHSFFDGVSFFIADILNISTVSYTHLPLTPLLKSDSMELGYGNMPLEQLIGIALSENVDAVVLESHKNWSEKSPLRSMEISAEFMKKYVR